MAIEDLLNPNFYINFPVWGYVLIGIGLLSTCGISCYCCCARSNKQKIELDKRERELDKRERDLDRKERDLDRKFEKNLKDMQDGIILSMPKKYDPDN
jgi:hypothetical protein